MFEQSKTNISKYGLLILTVLLLVINVFLIRQDLRISNRNLTFVMMDIGQGDALFIESPTGTQILIDGGPPRKILSALSKLMPLFDRTIDAIIVTNPDQDHIGGFLDVLDVYKVDKFFEPGTYNDSKTYQNLKSEIEKQKIPNILARKGMRLHLGGGAVIDILFPDRDVSLWTPNDGSIIAKLSYGETSVMLTGDATIKTEKIVLEEFSEATLSSTILKVGHHGSRTSTSLKFSEAISPKYALISAGKDNKYGHPHLEVLDTLASFGTKIFRTDMLGTIIMKSDGKNADFSFHR